MTRTVADIKKIMTDKFMADETLSQIYGFTVGDNWDTTFSKVSVENILFFIIALGHWFSEQVVATKQEEIKEIVLNNHYGNAGWYNEISKAFQYGDELVLKDNKLMYEVIDSNKQVVKYVATVPGKVVIVKAVGEQNGELVALSNAENEPVVDRLQDYHNKQKPYGTKVVCISSDPDYLKIEADIYLDSLLFNTNNGSLIIGGSRPVDDAINQFLKSIEFNGRLNKQKLIDAIQAVKGVTDIDNFKLYAKYGDYEYVEVDRAYLSYAGWMRIDPANKIIDTVTFKAEIF